MQCNADSKAKQSKLFDRYPMSLSNAHPSIRLLTSDSVSPRLAMPIRSCSTKIRYPTTAMTMKRMSTMRKMTMFSFMLAEYVRFGCYVVERWRMSRLLSWWSAMRRWSLASVVDRKTLCRVVCCMRMSKRSEMR